MADDPLSKIDVTRLFIAVPELTFNFDFLDMLRELGLLDSKALGEIARQRKIAKRADRILGAAMRGETIIKRLLNVAPEILNEEMVDLLSGTTWLQRRIRIRPRQDPLPLTRRMQLISPAQASVLRLAIRTLNAATRGGLPADKAQIFTRLSRILGVQISNERINLWRALGYISAAEAERYRGYLKSGSIIKESLVKAIRAKSLVDALMILGGITVDDDFIDGLVRAGIISARNAGGYKAIARLGIKEWKVFSGTRGVDGYRRRLLLAVTGSMNRQLLDLLLELKVINGAQWSMLQPLEIISRRVNDRILEDLVNRRFRVRVGEAPIRTFARAARVSDTELLRLLAEAAQEASKEAQALAATRGIGANTRSRQYQLAARGLHQAMRSLWERVGYLTIFGEREVAEAAAEAADALQRTVLKDAKKLADSILWQSKAGIDSYVSRQENTLALSRRVYKNMSLYQGQVDKRISLSLLQGKSPAEVASDVARYVSPNTPGGVSYAAKRLARTEINNAFHFSVIRYTRENPWVRGYKWNLSGSHGRPDICNEYAGDDHDNLGPGIFKKANVPGKPHPHCLCYITTVQMTEAQFIAAYRAGRFDSFMKSLDSGALMDAGPSSAEFSQYARRGLSNLASQIR